LTYEPKTKTISPVISISIIERLRAYTKRTGRIQNWVIERSLTEYLDREEKKEAEEKEDEPP
jgi:predicted transcriptional regulator